MDVELMPMDTGAVTGFLAHSLAVYAGALEATGMTAEAARRLARKQQDAAFPGGQPAAGHLLFNVMADGERAGHLWLGLDPGATAGSWWVWDIEIDPDLRGRGIGRQAMLLAEQEVRDRGGRDLGLSVFGDNPLAQRLYRSLDYRVVALRMRKTL